ncbi:MAG: hypothetical protein ACE5D7_05025 [Fidelibacterota bacterium]
MNKYLLISIIVISLFVQNCDNNQTTTADSDNLESILTNLVISDEDLNLNALSDEEIANELFIEEESGDLGRYQVVENYEFPIRWGRFVQSIEGNITFDSFSSDDDTIFASIERVIIGELVVVNGDTATTDSGFTFTPIDTMTKPFEMNSHRRIRFVKMFGNEDPFWGWRVNGKSPVIINSSSATVDISSISLNRQISVFEFEPIFSFDSATNLDSSLLSIQDIPHLLHHEYIKALANVENSNPDSELYPNSGEGVFLHYGRFHHSKGRHPMFDDGGVPNQNGNTSYDELENDNEFTRIFNVRRPINANPGVIYNMYFDVIDFESLLNPEGAYHSTLIGIPYMIHN